MLLCPSAQAAESRGHTLFRESCPRINFKSVSKGFRLLSLLINPELQVSEIRRDGLELSRYLKSIHNETRRPCLLVRLRVYFFSSDLLELEDSGRSTTPPVSSLS